MIFHYSSLNANGNKEEGDIDATSLDNAILLLQKKGITTLLEVKEKAESQHNAAYLAGQKFFKQKIELIVFHT